MFRIDSPSAVPSIPITPPPFAPGFFTDGNPASGAEATIVDAWWLNMVQEEILTVITSIGMAPDKADSSQLYQAIQRIAEAANPDLAGFLPLSGGVLYRPGGGDLLTIRVDQQATPALHARLISTVIGVRTWALGTDATGAFSITDISGDVVRMILGTGGVMTYNGNANISGNLTANASQITTEARAGQMTTTELNVGGQGIQYPALGPAHKIGWAFDGSNLSPRVDGAWSGGFNISGTVFSSGFSTAGPANTGRLTVAGNGIVYSSFTTSAIAFIWDGTNAGIRVDGVADVGLYAYRLNTGALGVAGNSEVSGNGNFGSLGCFGNVTVNGSVSTAYLLAAAADVTGPGVIRGQLDIPGPGFVYATERCVWASELHLVAGGIYSAAHGASPQGGPWNTALVLRTRADAIEPYEHGLAALRQLQPMIYDEQRLIGVALEDCRAAMPETIAVVGPEVWHEMTESVEMFNGTALTYALVNAVKELAERVEELETAWPKPVPA